VHDRLVAAALGATRKAVDPLDEGAFVLTCQQTGGHRAEGVVAAHRSVEPVQADRDVRPQGSRRVGGAQGESHGRVHGHREGEGFGPHHLGGRPRVDSQIEGTDIVARAPERGRR
jgi:hypothetical protein